MTGHRHIHGNYDGPKDGCTACAARPLIVCPVCRGYTDARRAQCGFCFTPFQTRADCAEPN